MKISFIEGFMAMNKVCDYLIESGLCERGSEEEHGANITCMLQKEFNIENDDVETGFVEAFMSLL